MRLAAKGPRGRVINGVGGRQHEVHGLKAEGVLVQHEHAGAPAHLLPIVRLLPWCRDAAEEGAPFDADVADELRVRRDGGGVPGVEEVGLARDRVVEDVGGAAEPGNARVLVAVGEGAGGWEEEVAGAEGDVAGLAADLGCYGGCVAKAEGEEVDSRGIDWGRVVGSPAREPLLKKLLQFWGDGLGWVERV